MTKILILVGVLAALQLAAWLRKRAVFRPPERITLERGAVPFRDEAEVAALVKPLLAEGFREIGTYRVVELRLAIRALYNPADQITAVVHDRFRSVPAWIDLVTRYEDGTSLTYGTARDAGAAALDQRPGHRKVRVPGGYPSAVLRRMRDERYPSGISPVRPQEFRSRFEAAWAEEMAWRASRGMGTADEIRRVAAGSGRPITEAEVVTAQQALAVRRSDIWGVDPR